MIDHELPKDWKDLQQKVAEILAEIGYKTEMEKDIKTVRETINVDVFSIDESQSPNIVYLCECKYWEDRIPRKIVHSFRTVAQDFGANFGIIISKVGFQKGAFEAARNTNIKLVDWFGFQDMFEDKWLPAIAEKLYNEFQALIDYTEPLVSIYIGKKADQLSKEGFQRFLKLRKKYMGIGLSILHFHTGRLYEEPADRIRFPEVLPVPVDENVTKTTKINLLENTLTTLRFGAGWDLKKLMTYSM